MSSHWQSAHFASVHFLSFHFSGGTQQVIEAAIDAGAAGDPGDLLRLPNGAIIAIAIGALLILDDDLEH